MSYVTDSPNRGPGHVTCTPMFGREKRKLESKEILKFKLKKIKVIFNFFLLKINFLMFFHQSNKRKTIIFIFIPSKRILDK